MATTTFHNDADSNQTQAVHTEFKTLSESILDSAKIGAVDDIISFLAKPYAINTGQISNNNTYGQVLETWNLYQDTLNFPVYTEKLKGFTYFRATTEIRIQVNAQRFQAGRYFLVYNPAASINGAYGNTTNFRNFSLVQLTQRPRIEIDLGTGTEAVLSVPYIFPTSAYSLVEGRGNPGSVSLVCYSPLRAGQSDSPPYSVDYTIWVSYKDVELSGPTYRPLAFGTQMAEGKAPVRRVAASEYKKAGAWSETFDSVGSAAKMLTKIPIVGDLAGPVSWACDIAGGLASAFGFSKKPTQQEQMPVNLGVPHDFNHTDGLDNSLPLSVFRTNEVEALPGFAGTSVDEMNLRYLFSIPSYYAKFTFSTSSTEGSAIYSADLTPHQFKEDGSLVNGSNTYAFESMTPVCFFSKMFMYYRGSFKFTFKIVKTEFHSGRVLLTYTPFTNINPSVTESAYTHREIIDIRDRSDFTFVVPYISGSDWRPVYNNNDQQSSYGRITVVVLNALRAPSTCNANVDFLVEVSAAEDYEVACPIQPLGGTNIDTNVNDQIGPFWTQMDVIPSATKIADKVIGSASIAPSDGISHTKYCIGESVTSVKQLLLRFSEMINTSGVTTVTDFNPFVIAGVGVGPLGGNYTSGYGDYFSLIGSCYAFQRGSVKIGLYSPDNTLASKALLYVPSNASDDQFIRNSTLGGGVLDTYRPVAYTNIQYTGNFMQVSCS